MQKFKFKINKTKIYKLKTKYLQIEKKNLKLK